LMLVRRVRESAHARSHEHEDRDAQARAALAEQLHVGRRPAMSEMGAQLDAMRATCGRR